MGKRIITVIAAILLAIAVPFTAYCSDINTLDGIKSSGEGVILYKSASLKANSTAELLDKLSDKAGEYTSDWYYIALSQYGINCKNEKSIKALKNAVNNFYKEGLEKVKVTDMQRTAFALLACGEDITDIDGHNLLADSSYNRESFNELDSQGVNALSYALLLLDSKDYSVPKSYDLNRDRIIEKILSFELEKGGYALWGEGADTDITAIVLQALAPYKNNAKVKKSIDSALSILSKRQDNSGAFKSFSGKITAESTAQVIIALTSLDINPTSDKRFIKNDNTTLDGLSLFKTSDGGFSHMTGLNVNSIATYQSLCAFVASYRYLKGGKPFYNFKTYNNSNTKTVNKIISKNHNKSKSKKTKKSSHILYKSYVKNNTSNNHNSKIENKLAEKKSQAVNNTSETYDAKPVEKTASLEETKAVNHKSTKNNKSSKSPLYLNAALLLVGYILVFSFKSGGKR